MPATLELPLIAIGVLTLLTLGYLLYGTFIARQYRLDDSRTTPAVLKEDGEDFIPTRPFYLLGQHFSAIAAAGFDGRARVQTGVSPDACRRQVAVQLLHRFQDHDLVVRCAAGDA